VTNVYLGEIRTYGFNFATRGLALCNGQILAISQNTALFSLLGTTYGGNGTTNFALPDLRGRRDVHAGNEVRPWLDDELHDVHVRRRRNLGVRTVRRNRSRRDDGRRRDGRHRQRPLPGESDAVGRRRPPLRGGGVLP